jgi:hypothetical protein
LPVSEDTESRKLMCQLSERQQQLELGVNDNLAMGAEDEAEPDPDNVCFNAGCLQFEVGEPNHCRNLEYVSQCDNPKGTGAPHQETTNDARPETEEAAEGSEAGNEVAGSAVGGGAADQLSQCATCVGLCGDFTPGTQVTECPNHACDLSEEQINWRDGTCDDWSKCAFSIPCFGPANEAEPDCLKDRAQAEPDIFAKVKINRAAGMSLHDAVAEASKDIPPEFACRICGFDGKSQVYLKRHLTSEHQMGWVEYKRNYPATAVTAVTADSLTAMREKRAKLIKNRGAK